MPATPLISLRPAVPSDLVFLRGLFADSRAADLGSLTTEFRERLTDIQFETQRREYASLKPDALDEIVSLDAAPVGRVWTVIEAGSLHVLDLAVCARYRGRGIGTAALAAVVSRCDAQGLAVRLEVWDGNVAARRLYARCGFRTDRADGGYVSLRRPAFAAMAAS